MALTPNVGQNLSDAGGSKKSTTMTSGQLRRQVWYCGTVPIVGWTAGEVYGNIEAGQVPTILRRWDGLEELLEELIMYRIGKEEHPNEPKLLLKFLRAQRPEPPTEERCEKNQRG